MKEDERRMSESEEKRMFKDFELIQNEVIHSDGHGELRGWEQPNNVIVLFTGKPGTENVEDYPQYIQFPKAAIPLLIAFLGRVDVPCSEGRRLFQIAWEARAPDHGTLYADYLEHITKCKECIATFRLTDADIQHLKTDADGYRGGAEALRKIEQR